MAEDKKKHRVPVILDLEASGFDPDSYPIEVGICLPSGKRVSSLIYPAESWVSWDEMAESVHHISNETLLSSGKPILKVAESLNKLLTHHTVYAEAWIVERSWVEMLFKEAGIEMSFRLKNLESIISDQQKEIWDSVNAEVVEKNHLKRHRASIDAWIIQQTFNETAKKTRAK